MESIVQNGRLVITRLFNESFINWPDAKIRSLLHRDDIDLVNHQHSLKDELLHVDNERRVLKERITEEGEAVKRECRNADRKKINRWKGRDEELLAYRTEIRNKLGDLKEAIKQRSITKIPKGDILAKQCMMCWQTHLWKSSKRCYQKLSITRYCKFQKDGKKEIRELL